MAKKTISKIAAIALAGLTAFSTVGVVANASVEYNASQEIWGTVVKVTDVTGVKSTYTYDEANTKWVMTQAPATQLNGFIGRTFASSSQASAAWAEYCKTAKPANEEKPASPTDGVSYSTYSFSYTTSSADLSALFGTNTSVKYDADTGEIGGTSGNDWTVINGSTNNNSGSNTGSGSSSSTNVSYSTPTTTHRVSSSYVYYSNLTGYYYPNLDALKSVEGNHANYEAKTPSTNYSTTNRYFDPVNGTYTSRSLNSYSYVVNAKTSGDITSIYKVGNYYYPTYNAAYNAANGQSQLISWISDYTVAPTNYFSEVTGLFYSTYAAALLASNNNAARVAVLDNAYYDGYYGYDYYYGYYGINDPYYYYFLNKNSGSSSSSSKDTTTATLGKKTGWTSIAKYLKSVSAGSSSTIDMNRETVVPSSVMSAIKGRNVTVKFVLDNGVVFTVNGKDVTTAKDVDLDTTYNTRSISSKLIKAAYKKNDAVSSAQLSIDAGTLGFTSDLTVKFSAKRGGYKAKLYRYNAAKNSLALVDTATIGSTGKCNFDKVTKGGEFVIVIYR